MKIRNGFVSNSSSSSFLIYGKHIETEELKFIAKKLEIDFDELMDCPYEYIEKFIKGTEVGYFDCCDGEEFYLGKSWSKIKDDQTGKEFKESIEKTLSGLFETEVKCRTIDNS